MFFLNTRNLMSSNLRSSSSCLEGLSKVSFESCCFLACNARIFSSMEPFMMNRTQVTGSVCPIRCTRSIAWLSTEGFQYGSIKYTRCAQVRFNPTPPAFSEINMTRISGFVLKFSKFVVRSARDIPPSSRVNMIPASPNATSIKSSKLVH